jgi:hypothetical protein
LSGASKLSDATLSGWSAENAISTSVLSHPEQKSSGAFASRNAPKETVVGKSCAKCGHHIGNHLQKHHPYPKIHFGGGPTLILCTVCHVIVECMILVAEGQRNKSTMRRNKLPRECYKEINEEFLCSSDSLFGGSLSQRGGHATD